jgi:hypothetical protein
MMTAPTPRAPTAPLLAVAVYLAPRIDTFSKQNGIVSGGAH